MQKALTDHQRQSWWVWWSSWQCSSQGLPSLQWSPCEGQQVSQDSPSYLKWDETYIDQGMRAILIIIIWSSYVLVSTSVFDPSVLGTLAQAVYMQEMVEVNPISFHWLRNRNCTVHSLMDELSLYTYYVTFHDKTMHIVPTTDFELRPPLPTTTFEWLLLQIWSL